MACDTSASDLGPDWHRVVDAEIETGIGSDLGIDALAAVSSVPWEDDGWRSHVVAMRKYVRFQVSQLVLVSPHAVHCVFHDTQGPLESAGRGGHTG